jgi:serine phosphatase RsbU (regulator of sigma subunit)
MPNNPGEVKMPTLLAAGAENGSTGAAPDRSQLLAEIARLMAEVDARDQKISEHKRNEQALADANIRSAMRLAELEEEKDALQTELSALASSTARSATQAEELEAQSAELIKANDDLSRRLRQFEVQKAVMEQARNQQEQELATLQEEFETLRTLQRMLLPQDESISVGNVELAYANLPAEKGGSNWVHFAGARDELGVFVGDVHGHGVARSLVSAAAFALISTLRHVHEASPTPKTGTLSKDCAASLANPRMTLALLNKLVAEMGRGQLFFPLFACMIDAKKRMMNFANAGHCVPIVLTEKDLTRPTAYTSPILTPRGVPLGSSDFASLVPPTATLQLEPGTIVLWHTCGVVENPGTEGRPLGVKGLITWVKNNLWREPAQRIADVLENRLTRFFGSEMRMDATVVIAKIH